MNKEINGAVKLIHERIRKFEKEKLSANYTTKDVRNYYYGMIHEKLCSYLKGYIFLDLSNKVNSRNLSFNSVVFTSIELDGFIDSVKNEQAIVHYLSHFHRNFIVGSWSIFELLITTMCENLLDTNEKKKLLEYRVSEIEKKLKTKMNSQQQKKFAERFLSRVPMPGKYFQLQKICKHYGRGWSEDKEFLRFFGAFRNAIHSNWIYYGNESWRYSFRNETEFYFTPNKIIRYNTSIISPKLYLDLTEELMQVSSELTSEFSHVIEYPDLNAQVLY